MWAFLTQKCGLFSPVIIIVRFTNLSICIERSGICIIHGRNNCNRMNRKQILDIFNSRYFTTSCPRKRQHGWNVRLFEKKKKNRRCVNFPDFSLIAIAIQFNKNKKNPLVQYAKVSNTKLDVKDKDFFYFFIVCKSVIIIYSKRLRKKKKKNPNHGVIVKDNIVFDAHNSSVPRCVGNVTTQ